MVTSPIIGVSPPEAFRARRRLFDVLGAAVDVRFREQVAGNEPPDGLLQIGSVGEAPAGVPTYIAGVAVLEPSADRVRLSTDARVPGPLRDRSIADWDVGRARPLTPRDDEEVLAQATNGPSWTVSRVGAAPHFRAVVAPDELAPNERLCDRLTAGCFASLLPLVEFLRAIAPNIAFAPPTLRAAFIIDDPNLHASSYGFLRYDAVATLARRHGFHVALATVPLDSWLTRRSSASHFRGAEAPLSLLVHGNDHIHRELARDGTSGRAIARLAQALSRIERLERRADVIVSRVMAPPHGACSRITMACLQRVGFEAMCVSRPYPWLDGPPTDQPRAGWHPADMVEGLAVLPRTHLTASREDFPLSAYLGRPIILYGHHWDAADGLDVFVDAANEVNRLGMVNWLPLHRIARASFETYRRGSELHVRLWTRLASVTVPPGVDRVVVQSPGIESLPQSATGLGSHEVEEGQMLTLRVPPDSPVDIRAVELPAWRPWPLARRLLVETRDRAQPLVRHIRGIAGQP